VSGGDGEPILINDLELQSISKLLLRALNKNQILILKYAGNGFKTITSLLRFLSKEFGIPLSTLKLNAKILKDLKLIDYSLGRLSLTKAGITVLKLIGGICFEENMGRWRQN